MVSERDWVRIRADCTLEQAFSEICNAMISDVKAFNGLAESKRNGRLFHHTEYRADTPRTLTVFQATLVSEGVLARRQGSNDCVSVGLSVGSGDPCIVVKIVAEKNGGRDLKVRHSLNDETLSCDLIMDEDNRRYSVSGISRTVLGDFLFGGPDWW